MEVKIGRTKLIVPHEKGKCTFIYPSVKGTLKQCARQIDERNLKRPNSSQTASLIYDSWQNPNGEYEGEIIDILKKNWFWESTANLYLPKSNEDYQNGVILWDDLEFNADRTIKKDKKGLIKKLEQGDKTVRFVPFGFKIGELNISEISKHAYFIARYGENGAEKIAKVAEKYKKDKPVLWSFKSVDEEKVRASALGEYVARLGVNGNNFGDDRSGHAFGVLESCEAAQKIN